jgi:MoaA/NifB/PqqE/SkfB family radical SAM enzyme
MTGIFKSIKFKVNSRLTDAQKAFLRLLYNIIKTPGDFMRHLNKFNYDRNVLRKVEVNFTPPLFVATITNNCNLRCPTCLYLLENPNKFNATYIALDKFQEVLEKYNTQNKAEVIFLSGGEPLLHPQFGQLIDICKKHHFIIKTSTNGILVKNKIDSLLKLSYVNVSLDSHDYDSYEKYRGGTAEQFDLVMEGLKILREKGCYFGISYVLSTENLSEVDKMIKLAEEIRPNVVYLHNINPHGCEQYKPLVLQDRDTKLFLEKISKRTDYPFDLIMSVVFDNDSPLFRQAKCVQPWLLFSFNEKGDISYCCHLSHDVNIGNAFAGYNFNSPKMVGFRKDIIGGRIPKSCLYCQRRFMGKEFGHFDSRAGKWFIFGNC